MTNLLVPRSLDLARSITSRRIDVEIFGLIEETGNAERGL